jgi:predicted nucleic acid-binding protein
MMRFVVDTSTTMTWCFNDETTAATDALLDQLQVTDAVVPSVWPLEVANALLVAERRRRITENEAIRLAHLLQSLPIRIDADGAARALGIVLTLAREHTLSSYDASYLELAIRQGLPLATQNTRLRAAATRAGVPLL